MTSPQKSDAAPSGPRSTITYDLVGRPKTTTDARALTTTLTYWPTGELRTQARQEPGGGTTTITSGYDQAGRRTTMTDPSGTTTWGYDSAGQVRSVTSAQGTVGYDYDAAGRRKQMTVPATAGAPGGQVNYGFDGAGRVIPALLGGGLVGCLLLLGDVHGAIDVEAIGGDGVGLGERDDVVGAVEHCHVFESSAAARNLELIDN